MRLPAEWEKQSAVQLTWPDESTPWYELDKVQDCYAKIAAAIQKRELLMIVSADTGMARAVLGRKAEALGLEIDLDAIRWMTAPVNDTWARDHGAIAVYGDNGEKYIYDFVFNGWGLKFASDKDNLINRRIFFDNAFAQDVMCVDMRPFVLEGGSIDTDGRGTLLTSTQCLTSANRNDYLEKDEIEAELKSAFGLERVLWLDHGGIAGDDTDSHVDIMARFCDGNTIAYTRCTDPDDENYEPLRAMEDQLRTFRTAEGKKYDLIPLPLPDALYLDGYRLPASYANFLIINGAVLVPGTGSAKDDEAAAELRKAFPDREVEVIDCRPLLSGHGGLHCVTMQFPDGWII